MSEPRFVYAIRSTRQKAESALEDYFASGEIVPAERPEIERRVSGTGRTVFVITLPAG